MKGASRAAKFLLLFALIAVAVITVFSGCGEIEVEEEPRPDYYVLCDKKAQKYHDQSCSELPMNENLIKMEYESTVYRGYYPCMYCDPDNVYSSGSYIKREYTLSERIQNFYKDEIERRLEVFPEYSQYDGFWDYVGHVFFSDVLLHLPGAFLFASILALSVLFTFVCRVLVICAVLVVIAAIALFVYWVIINIKRRRNGIN